MDKNILRQKGIHASNLKKGYLEHYTLRIGKRASLIQAKNERAYGVLMEIDNLEIMKLYTEESVADYIPELVKVVTTSNEKVTATCYNLPIHLITGVNKAYAMDLYKLAKELKFPKEYLDKIIAN